MWWRALGVALVLLGLGGVIGYAVADDAEEQPQEGSAAAPLVGVSPSVPTPPVYDVFPDPTAAPLEAGVETATRELRITRRGAGVSLLVPVEWEMNRQE